MKRWALIAGDRVANVVEQDAAPQLPGTWVEAASAGPGWRYSGGVFTPAAAAGDVLTVSRRQALRALNDAGLLASVESAINAMAEPAKTRTRIDWDNAGEFRRDHAVVLQLGAALGLTAAQLDALFLAASAYT